MKLIKVILFFLFYSTVIFAQKEHYVWYFGDSAGVDFNLGFPSALPNGSLYTWEGCASICDSAGNILFYTNGNKVWNRNHIQMLNGFGLSGGFSSTQSALIVPFIGNNSSYYIFTVSQWGSGNAFQYSVVDMTLDNGNGDITVKNHGIIAPMTEKLTGVKHSNNTDIWVTVHGSYNNSFYSYLVTSSGISSNAVISSIGPNFTINEVSGQMKFSPDGTKLVYAASGDNYVDLFDFNSTTGVISNEKYLSLPVATNGAYGTEFSISGRYLYAAAVAYSNIYQWDISSNVDSIINSTIQQVNSSVNLQFGSMQLAPDGKIYIAEYLHNFLSSIDNPEVSGTGCSFVQNAVSLGNKSSLLGLPNFIQSVFRETGYKENNSLYQISVYPNPFYSNVYITIQKQNNKPVAFTIINALGQTVFNEDENSLQHNYNETIDLSFLSKGVYFLEVKIDGVRNVKKILKE